MGKLKAVGAFALFLLVVFVIGYLFWYLPYQYERTKNYKLGYESHVVRTICEMVKPEYLKNPDKCN